MKRHTRVLVAWLLAAAALGGCDGAPNLPEVSGSDGAARFSFSGARSGSFVAAGDYRDSAGQWAYGTQSALGWTQILAVVRKPDGSDVLLLLGFRGALAPGTIPLYHDACPQDGPCAAGSVQFTTGLVPGMDNSREVFGFARGTLRITRVADGRVLGTFSGEAISDTGTITVKDGRFDVPLVAL